MSAPDKCPGCGADLVMQSSGSYFRCGTWATYDGTVDQSRDCTSAQRDQLAAKLEGLNRANATAREMLCAELGIPNDGSVGIIDAISALKEANANLTARLSVAERERDQALAVLGAYKMDKDDLAARVRELEAELERAKEDRNHAGVIARRQMLPQMEELSARVKELDEKLEAWKAYAERLDQAGCDLTFYATKSAKDNWNRVLQSKPMTTENPLITEEVNA